MKTKKCHWENQRWTTNTDTVDIANKQIGLTFFGRDNREFHIGIKHVGTKESVNQATKLAQVLAEFLNNPDPEMSCPDCGCNELLCGFPRQCCTKEEEE
jgi:hypothetical protein